MPAAQQPQRQGAADKSGCTGHEHAHSDHLICTTALTVLSISRPGWDEEPGAGAGISDRAGAWLRGRKDTPAMPHFSEPPARDCSAQEPIRGCAASVPSDAVPNTPEL